MSRSIVVVGYGPGISHAVAERFGGAGFEVAIVGRSKERLEQGAASLREKGVRAKSYVGDASDPESIAGVIGAVRSVGTIASLHWNAYSRGAGNLLTAPLEQLRAVADVPVVGLVAAVRAALPDLESVKGSVLVTNGGFGFLDAAVEQAAVRAGAMGLSVGNAAKRKLVALLHHQLQPRGVYVGEVVVAGTVKGTAFDRGNATLESAAIAEAFWRLHEERREVSVTVR